VGRLTLVRHGQARSFHPEQPLTPLGEAQAAHLAAWWLRHGIAYDEVETGCLARQIRTEQAVAEAFRAAGRDWPEARRDPAWNEYDATAVLATLGQPLPEDNRGFQKLLESGMIRWLAGELAGPHIEPWPTFRDRVSTALARVQSGSPGRRVAVFTSGGVIGFAVHVAMHSPPPVFLDVNWRIRNASLTEFLYDRARLTLDAFNRIGHLEDETLWSYR
jgi:broad specificity phosphatase PhoE